MVWNKMKQRLESFLNPSLTDRVKYLASGYRYLPDKQVHCYITVDKKEVFNMKDSSTQVRWYQSEQEVKNDESLRPKVTAEDIESIRNDSNGKIPDERIMFIAMSRKIAQHSKDLIIAQNKLYKTDFQKAGITFLSESIERSLGSDDILLNVLAIIDRRVGKKRLLAMEDEIQMKHPIVKYFYELRRNS